MQNVHRKLLQYPNPKKSGRELITTYSETDLVKLVTMVTSLWPEKVHLCGMNWIKRQWAAFRAKSFWGKFWDVLFVVVIVLFLVPDGRMFVQRMIVKTGLMGSTKANVSEDLNPESKQWQLEDMAGNRFSLADLNDRPVFLNHWATWCPPCRAEMPSIISLIEQTGDDAVFLLVTSEDRNRVRAFLENQDWEIPVYFPVTPIPTQLAAESLPTTLVINASGQIIHRSEGMRDWESEAARELVVGE